MAIGSLPVVMPITVVDGTGPFPQLPCPTTDGTLFSIPAAHAPAAACSPLATQLPELGALDLVHG